MSEEEQNQTSPSSSNKKNEKFCGTYRDVPLEESLYHYYIWKERQAMIQEESQRRYKSNLEEESKNDTKNVTTTTSTTDPKSLDTVVDVDDATDKVTLSKDLFSHDSIKYRQIWNLIRFLFPSIAEKGNIHEASEILPEVYRRYTEFPKFELSSNDKDNTNNPIETVIGLSTEKSKKRDHSGSPTFSWRKKPKTEEIKTPKYKSSLKKPSRSSRRKSQIRFRTDSSDDESNNRYVGGIDSRGGGR